MKEIWKEIKGYEWSYHISSIGRVKSIERYVKHAKCGKKFISERILKPYINSAGYYSVRLCNKGIRKTKCIHQLMAIIFLGHIPNGHKGLVVDHINNDKSDNRLDNLQLITHRYNSSKDKTGGTSEYIGVSWKKEGSKWESQIKIKGKKKYLGYFANELDASIAYQDALKELNLKL